MKSIKKILLAAFAAIFVLAALVGCGATPEAPASESPVQQEAPAAPANALEAIKQKGVLVMGVDDAFPPMGFLDESGEIVGFDIDVAKEVAKRMGVELKVQKIDWSAKILDLNSKRIDVIWNGFTITDERKQEVLFSNPYMASDQLIVVANGSPIKTKADIAGKVVAVQDGSSAMGALEKDADLYASIAQRVDFSDNVQALLDVRAGRVDALVVDEVVARYYVNLNEENQAVYTIIEETLAPEEYGIGFRKGEEALRDEVQRIMDEMKADGTLGTICEKWMGKDITK